MADLSVKIAGVTFKNPIIVGSASPSMDWIGCKKGIDGGCSGVIVKSLFGEKGKLGRSFPRPRFKLYDYKDYPGYPQKLPHAFTLNSLEECSHFGYQEYMEDVNRAKDAVGDNGIIMASLSGVTLDEWVEMVGLVNETNADWVELNVSCPFAADMGVKMGAGAVDMTADVVRTCAGLLKKPFSVKVSPQTVDQSSVALACQEAGAMAVNLSARFSGYDLDIDTARPIGPGAQGGWGGPYFIGYGIKNCAIASRKLSIPIIAGLGVWDWKDIIKYTMVGASLVQSGVGLMLQGYDVAKKWNENINQWLDARGYKSLDDIRGIALPNILKTAEVVRAPEGVYGKVNYEKCTKCGVCKRSCFYDAISLTKVGAVIDQNKCDGCGMCMEVCPVDAVTMTTPQQRLKLEK
jgi:dihydropyrimidine dehydrogenase (NAD+) subunit PreA